MHALPFVFSLLAAVALAPGLLATLSTRPNHRGAQVAFPFGLLIVAGALVALVVFLWRRSVGRSRPPSAEAPNDHS